MPRPFFSVIIPTRNRANYLAASMRTVLDQACNDYELIVCDNASSDETRKVVDSLRNEKVQYYRSETSLAMTDNWELAISKAAGEYLILIGDDDGLLLHSLEAIRDLLQLTKATVCHWRPVSYCWPDFPSRPNQLSIPVGVGFRTIDGKDTIRRVLHGREYFNALPMIYHSVVHRSVVERIRAIGGRVLGSRSPDLFSGFAIAYIAEKYIESSVPLSISGLSRGSSGCNLIDTTIGSGEAEDFDRLNSVADLQIHPSLPRVPVFIVCVADSFLRCKDRLFPKDKTLALDRKALARECLYEFQTLICSEAQRGAYLDEIASKFPEFKFVSRKISIERARESGRNGQVDSSPSAQTRFADHHLLLDADRFGAQDVLGAAHLVEGLLGYRENKVIWSEPRRSRIKRLLKDMLPPLLYRRAVGAYIAYLHSKSRR